MSLSLKAKFRVLFATIIVFVAAAGWLIVDQLAMVNAASSTIVDHLMPVRSQLFVASSDAVRFRLAEARHILSTSDEAIRAEDTALNGLDTAIRAALTSVGAAMSKPQNVAAAGELQTAWQNYVAGEQPTLAASRANRNEEAYKLYGSTGERFDTMRKQFEALIASLSADVGDARHTSENVYRTVSNGATTVVVVVLIAAVAAAMYFESNVTRAILRLCAAMGRIAEGDLSIEVPETRRADELGAMAKTVQTFKDNGLAMRRMEAEAAEQRKAADAQRAKADADRAAAAEQQAAAAAERERANVEREAAAARQAEAMAALTDGLAQLAEGNLAVTLNKEFAPEYERVRVDFNAAVAGVQTTVREIMAHSAAIGTGISEIANAADDLAKRTEQQAASLEETASALTEITETVKQTAASSEQAQAVAETAKQETATSEKVVSEAVSAMGEIEGSARQIGQIIGVIDEIAFQTNLLALNAGVEAARAGEAGRGFAVVASEVRALAQRAADAAKEIKTLVTTSMRLVERGVRLVGETGEALGRIQVGVTRINHSISEIAASAQEQANGLAEVNGAVNQMDQVTQQNAAMVEQSTSAVHSLSKETEQLNLAMSRFRLGGGAEIAVKGHKPATPPVRRPVAVAQGGRRGAGHAAEAENWDSF